MIKPNLFLVINEDCNLNCSYCNVVKTSKELSRVDIVKSFTYFFRFFHKSKSYNIFFIWWESLLSWKNLMFSILFLRKFEIKSGRQITIQLPTNWTLLSEEKCEFFRRYNVKVSVSIDSLKSVYHHRDFSGNIGLTSVSIITRKIDLIRKYEDVFRVKMVVIPEMLESMISNFKDILEQGIKFINIQPAHGVYWSDENIDIYISKVTQIKSDIAHHDECGSSTLKNTDSETYKMKKCAKGDSEICIDGYGNILVCDAFLAYSPEERSRYAHDSIYIPNFNKEKFEAWRDWKYCNNTIIANSQWKMDTNITKCKTCNESISCSKLCNAVPINWRDLNQKIILSNFNLFKKLDSILN